MKQIICKTSLVFFLIALIVAIVKDSRPHFDRALIDIKRKNQSAQRDWNVFYDQRYVYADSSFRYQSDFDAIAKFAKPNSIFLSDISTSYYLSAHLPAYIQNIHRHHGRHYNIAWDRLLRNRTACYLQDAKNVKLLDSFFKSQNRLSVAKKMPKIRYIVVNKDQQNINLRQDCLWVSRKRLIDNIESLSVKLYDGQYLSVYSVE